MKNFSKSFFFSAMLIMSSSAFSIDLIANYPKCPNLTGGQSYEGFDLGVCYKEATKQATANIIVKMYLSKDDQLDGSDVLLGSTSGQVREGYNQICAYLSAGTVPNINWESGTVYVISVVDATNVVSETDETNNTNVDQITFTKGAVTSFEGENVSFDFTLYPNPVEGVLNLDFNGDAKISVYDMRGQVIYLGEAINELVINTSSFSKGMYYVEVEKLNNVKIRKKFLVK